MPRLLLLAAAALLALHIVHDVTDFGTVAFDTFFALWFQPFAYLACGAAVLGRAAQLRQERLPWLLLGGGIVLYGAGSVVFNLSYADNPSPPFPSVADGLWLAIYPLVFGAVVMIVRRRRFAGLGATVWLDGVIGGTVVAAVAAALVFQPVFDLTVANGAASVARLAYPVGDLVCVGFAVVVWSLSGRRLDAFWALIGTGFALLALGDSVYVVLAARGAWAPGGTLDLPYTLALVLIAAAAWAPPKDVRATSDALSSRVMLPVGFALSGVALAGYGVIGDLNPLAIALTLVTLLAVAARFSLTLTRLTRQRADLAALAATDPLTGLANHRVVHERLAEELARAVRRKSSLSVIALDIDHFKVINDTYGHSDGDAALQAIAGVLSAECRLYDLVGRVGGEEFGFILPGADPEQAHAIAERCRTALLNLKVHGAPVSCSAGIASYPRDDPDGNRLLEMADGALYWAKRSGRGTVRRFNPREVVLLSSAEQQSQVRALLAAEDALTPVFQPIVELATGRIGGYEALSRFPQTEPVRAPDLWFAQARRCGLGAALEARAIERALAVPGRPPGTFLTINISPAALLSPEVAAVLPADLSDIVIELTEDDLFSSDVALDVGLAELRGRGARIAVDDAGAGYAGLQELIRIKPDILKLDRSLIQGLHTDGAKIALLEALTRFATTTGAAVCGEGIEEIGELRTLARLDVTYAQGYLLARPAPAWPGIATEVARETSAEARWGMRLAASTVTGDGPVSLGDVTHVLSRVRTREDLSAALELVKRVAHADEVAVSRVLLDERCVVTVSEHDWAVNGERFFYEDYPSTERVVETQVIGQVVAGDRAADPAELRVLAHYGYSAVLMAPIVFRAETIGLLEIYRRNARAWTSTEMDQARMLAHHLGSAPQITTSDATPSGSA